MKSLAIWLIRLYQAWISPRLPPGICNLEPTCSHYGLEAFRKYGFIRGLRLTYRRLIRCGRAGRTGSSGVSTLDPIP